MQAVLRVRESKCAATKGLGRRALVAATVGLCLAVVPAAFAVPVNLGGAADYAVVGVGNTVMIASTDFEIYQSATVVNGNVAQGPHTQLTHGIDATVNGRWDYDTTDANPSASGYTGLVTGGFHQLDLSGVSADARAASVAAAAMVPTQTFTTLTEDQVIVGNGGLNVIRITGDVTLKKGLTLQGGAGDSFVFQLTSPTTDGHDILTLSGMIMNITGVNPDNIVWDLNGLGGGIAISSGAVVYGNFLAPDRDILSDHGTITGRLIGGGSGNEVSIHSGSTITNTVPDGGATCALLGLALIGVSGFRRMFRS